MEIQDKLVFHGMTQTAADKIEYNNICTFHNSDRNTPGYYIVQWKGNAYTLQEKCTCIAFDNPVLIPEDEIVYPDKFMTPMRENSYWYHDPDKSIPIVVKLKQVVMSYIELIQDKNTKYVTITFKKVR